MKRLTLQQIHKQIIAISARKSALLDRICRDIRHSDALFDEYTILHARQNMLFELSSYLSLRELYTDDPNEE